MALQYDDRGFALESGIETCHCCYPTGEYIGEQDIYVSINTGLPAHAYLDGPGEVKDGYWPVRTGRYEQWHQVADHRGKIAYEKSTLVGHEISSLGEITDTHTLLAPASQYDKWVDDKWVTDSAAEDAAAIAMSMDTRSSLLAEANQRIAVLGDAVDLGMATEGEVDSYNAWRRYRVELTRLDLTIQPVNWPAKPQ